MLKKTKKDKQAPKGGKRKDALVDKLLSVDDLKIVAGGVTNRCCTKAPCE